METIQRLYVEYRFPISLIWFAAFTVLWRFKKNKWAAFIGAGIMLFLLAPLILRFFG